MNLKSATGLALAGVSVQFLWTLLMTVQNLHVGNVPLLYRLAVIPTLLFEASLIAFFATLLKKQQATGAANE